ncbi:4'-phosphopantetheinyl transferase family protein [Vibrio palustris]|uniref:Enterobactin synthase component D n=1 Tax=Vibrio palustris TaxID=1918946 RepID=A0A1R4B8A2_9VIBR|nr:4'-phosphopantetheinyl transferase superfamily protein [Vibrio palustris]SJL85126.1 4'-phosphopantetheinyl transferase Npt [Vibrio palustris]
MAFIGHKQSTQLGGMVVYFRQFDPEKYRPSRQTLSLIKRHSLELAVKKRQVEFIAGRQVANDALSTLGFSHDTVIPIGSGREPVWPTGIVGSISHNHNTAVCVTSQSDALSALGVDVETLLQPSVIDAVLPLIATPNEIDLFNMSRWTKSSMATVLFSAKESVFKALYPRVKQYLEFKDAVLTELNEVSGTATFTLSSYVRQLCGKTECRSFFRLGDHQVITLTYF